ncbi:MAG: hypothetical protein ACYTBS_07445 [Planctomycetota bacterium]|jgi:hypothetical protein
MNKITESAGKVIPGTNQVKINPVVTMVMTVVAWGVTNYTSVSPTPEVWVAVSGLISYGLQYLHGPRSE